MTNTLKLMVAVTMFMAAAVVANAQSYNTYNAGTASGSKAIANPTISQSLKAYGLQAFTVTPTDALMPSNSLVTNSSGTLIYCTNSGACVNAVSKTGVVLGGSASFVPAK